MGRQSTWTRDKLAGAHRINLLDEGLYHGVLADASLFAAELNTLPPAQLAGLSAIRELPGVVRRIMIYGGARRLKTPAGIEVWPLAGFLAALETGKLWP